MGIPVQSRWWVLTLAVIGVLVLISMLALDRPNVIWAGETPECPHCRHDVELYSHRCADCGGEFDWFAPSEDEAPISSASLSAQEAEWIRERVKVLGPEVAAQRIATDTGLNAEAAAAYLASVGRGDCGWCGGTRIDLAAKDGEDAECPACFGSAHCVACGGDRRVLIGDQRAARALLAYKRELADLLQSRVPDAVKRDEARRMAREFLASHEGTREAQSIAFWPALLPRREGGKLYAGGEPIVVHSRRRLDRVLHALRSEDG
jgi:hypothetical protein